MLSDINFHFGYRCLNALFFLFALSLTKSGYAQVFADSRSVGIQYAVRYRFDKGISHVISVDRRKENYICTQGEIRFYSLLVEWGSAKNHQIAFRYLRALNPHVSDPPRHFVIGAGTSYFSTDNLKGISVFPEAGLFMQRTKGKRKVYLLATYAFEMPIIESGSGQNQAHRITVGLGIDLKHERVPY
jgi:hypothetical protein